MNNLAIAGPALPDMPWEDRPATFEQSVWQRTKIGAGPVSIETSVGWQLFYYGCADTVTGLAFGYIPEIIEFTKKNSIL